MGLEFLLPDAGELLLDLAIEAHRYEAAISVVRERVRFMVAELQPALEKTGLQETNLDEIEAKLGIRFVRSGKSRWEQVCSHVTQTSESLLPVLERLRAELKRKFPDEKFLSIVGPVTKP